MAGLLLTMLAGCGGDGATTPASPSSTMPTILVLESGPTHPLLRGETRRFTPDQAPFWAGVDCYENHIEMRVGAGTSQWTVSLGAPRGQRLTIGTYENATSYPANKFGSGAGIRIGGEGRGCTDVGRFVVHEARYLPSGAIDRFQASFEHRCDRFPDSLRGEVTLIAPPGTQASCP